MPPPLSEHKRKFIIQNKGLMKQVDIAAHLKISAACVCQIIKGRKSKIVTMDGYFDIDDFKKYYSA